MQHYLIQNYLFYFITCKYYRKLLEYSFTLLHDVTDHAALHCIALHCIALHCIALHCIALHCIAYVTFKLKTLNTVSRKRMKPTFWLMRSTVRFWELISLPMSTAMLRRLPIMPLTSPRFCSISFSRSSFVILKRQPTVCVYLSTSTLGNSTPTLSKYIVHFPMSFQYVYFIIIYYILYSFLFHILS